MSVENVVEMYQVYVDKFHWIKENFTFGGIRLKGMGSCICKATLIRQGLFLPSSLCHHNV